jgi:hypothetical protein
MYIINSNIIIIFLTLFPYSISVIVPLYSSPQDWIPSDFAVGDFFLTLSSNYNPYMFMYIGTPHQTVNLSFTFSSDKTWITDSYFIHHQRTNNFNFQSSSSYDKDELKQSTCSYKLHFFSNYISFDFISPVNDTEIISSLTKKYQFLLQHQTQSTLDEMVYTQGGQIGLSYPQIEEEPDSQKEANPNFSLNNYFWLNNLKENQIIKHRTIGLTFDSLNGTAYIGEQLNLTVSNISFASNNSLTIPLTKISLNDDTLKISLLNVVFEFSFDQHYIFAYGKEAQKLFNIIMFKLNNLCTVENNGNDYKGIVCNKSKKNEIFGNFTGMKFKFGESNNDEISFLPSDMFIIRDDLMVFKIVFQFAKVNKPWVFGTMFFKSNIIMFDFDSNTFSIGKITSKGKDLNTNNPSFPGDFPSFNDDIIIKPMIIPFPQDDKINKQGNKIKQKGFFELTIILSLFGLITIVVSKYIQNKANFIIDNMSLLD